MCREENEDENQWMDRNHAKMKRLALILNLYCPEHCKVLLMGMDLLCFNLSVLAENADKVYLYNIVGVTGHHGMVKLPTISRVNIRFTHLHTKHDHKVCTIHAGRIFISLFTIVILTNSYFF